MKTGNTAQNPAQPDRPARILFVSPFSSLYGGELCFLEIVTGVDRERIIPEVVLSGEGPLTGRLKAAGIKTDQIEMPYMTHRGTQGLLFLAGLLPVTFRLVRHIRAGHYDLVYNNSLLNPYGTLAAWLARVPRLWHVHDMGKNPMLRFGITRFAGALSNQLIVVSKAVRDLFSEKTQKKITVVYNGVDVQYYDPEQFDRLAVRRQFGIRADQAVIGYIGRFHESKRPFDLLYALHVVQQKYPGVVLLMVGEGELGEALKEKASALGLSENVRWAGYLADIRPALVAMDVVALPSDHEAFPRVPLEAMAMEKPVTATRVGGIPEQVDDGCGYLYAVGDTAALAAAWLDVLDHPEKACEMGWRGRQKVIQNFQLKDYVNQIQTLLLGMLSH
jgi:glycosyltransferase involved in cell wall biosynthesis